MMEDKKKLEIFESAPISKVVMTNALPAMGAATPALLVSMSRQGLVFIPALFVLQAVMGLNGIVWAQPVADIVSLALAAVLFVKTFKRRKSADVLL